MKNYYQIRNMSKKDLDTAVSWAAKEGWNPGIHDSYCFYAADPNGFLIGLLDDEPVAMVSAVAYEDSYGFMGFYIVKPEVRHRTYGRKFQIGSKLEIRKFFRLLLDNPCHKLESHTASREIPEACGIIGTFRVHYRVR